MDPFDSLRKLARGDGAKTVPIEFASGEREIYRVVSSARPGSLRNVGGDLEAARLDKTVSVGAASVHVRRVRSLIDGRLS